MVDVGIVGTVVVCVQVCRAVVVCIRVGAVVVCVRVGAVVGTVGVGAVVGRELCGGGCQHCCHREGGRRVLLSGFVIMMSF